MRKTVFAGIVFSLASGYTSAGCISQGIEYYKYMSKEELIIEYKRLRIVSKTPPRGEDKSCYVGEWVKVSMVLKKEYGITDNSPELQ